MSPAASLASFIFLENCKKVITVVCYILCSCQQKIHFSYSLKRLYPNSKDYCIKYIYIIPHFIPSKLQYILTLHIEIYPSHGNYPASCDCVVHWWKNGQIALCAILYTVSWQQSKMMEGQKLGRQKDFIL